MNRALEFRGHNRNGASVTGRVQATPASFVEQCYRRRWVDLTVVVECGEGWEREVGAIERHPDTGRRIWWAES